MRINKYLPFALIYFFINSLALPFGLTYTAILSPLFYWWIITQRKQEPLLPFLVCLAPFIVIHFINGVDSKTYIVSVINYIMVYIFCQAFYTFLKKCEEPEKIFRQLLIINFLFCLVAIPFYFTAYSHVLWMESQVSDGISNLKRLKFFNYEASYYAVLFTPLFSFYFLQLVLRQNKINAWSLMAMLFLPYFLSLSIGVMSCLLLSVTLTYLVYFKKLSSKTRVLNLIVLGSTISVLVFIVLWWFFPQNSIFLRLENIFSWKDTSGKGRTSEAFLLAMKMLEQKSVAWGIGAGQVKVLGADIIRSYYLYSLDYNTIAIPNASAETLAIFGWIGLCIRVLIELVLFFYTRVWTNYYRLLLFIFIFVYQFTGSFVTNLAEYVIWILAFTNVFKEFDVRSQKSAVRNQVLIA